MMCTGVPGLLLVLFLLHENSWSFAMKYININQLSEKLAKRSRSSILRDVESGLLPRPVKFGGRLYWIESEIDAAFQALSQAA